MDTPIAYLLSAMLDYSHLDPGSSMKTLAQIAKLLVAASCFLLCAACADKTAPAQQSTGVLTEAQQSALKGAKQTEQQIQDANTAALKKIDEASAEH